MVLSRGTAVLLGLGLIAACGGEVDDSSRTGGAGTGGSTATGGNPSMAGSSGALPTGGTGGCYYGLPLPEEPCFTCEPLGAGGADGCGSPAAMWGWDGSVDDQSLSYPVGCTVYLPVENPFYPGGPQSCSCEAWMPDGDPAWTCPI